MIKGITFLGKHSFKDMAITLTGEKDIGIPDKVKNIRRAAFSNVDYDFSRIYGEQIYDNRNLTYYFNIGVNSDDVPLMNREKTKIINWLLDSKGKQPLYDDDIPGWHFLAEVENNMSFQEYDRIGILAVTFTAYPFMIRNDNEGDDLWDTFDFEYDVAQDLITKSSMGSFKELEIGSYATIGAYATAYDGLKSISRNRLGVSRKIISKKATTQGNSRISYQLEGMDEFVLEQDIVQSRISPTKMTIINNGKVSVPPEVITTNKISILKDNVVYNFFPGSTTESLFRLSPGENHLEITSVRDTNIEFRFFKELI